MKTPILILLLLASISLVGQEKQTDIKEVEVSGKFLNLAYKNTNENVIVITRKDIENSPSVSIDELLQQFTGLDIRRRGASGVQSDITIRGGSFEQVLLLINGIRMNDSQTGHNSMNIPVDLSSVDRIEVMKGPAARRFGQNAYAGVINIITKTSTEETAKISTDGGDFSTFHLGLNSTFGKDKFSHLFQANSSSSEGYRYNTDYKINNIFYQNRYDLANGFLQFQAGFQAKKFGANGFYASPRATEQYEETQASVVSAAFQKKWGNFMVTSDLYWRRGQDMYIYIRNKPEIYRNMHIGNNIGGEFNTSYQWKLGVTGVGVELRKEFLVSNNLGHRDRFVTQFFFEHYFSLLENKLKITPGISWANFTGNGNFFYPGIDVGYDISNEHKIYGNLAKVNRIPSFTDLYYVSGTEQGNALLLPESALSYELGYRFEKNHFMAKASVFGRNTKDGIDWIKNNIADKWMAENIGKITTHGFELELKQNFMGFLKSYSVGYTFLENKPQQSANYSRYIADNLKHQLVAKMENKFLKNFTNELVYRYCERMDHYSYHLLDEKLSYNFKKLNVFLLINNLTNTNYTETFGVPMPKRWFHVGLSYTIHFNENKY